MADVNIYDPTSNTWTGAAPLNTARNRHVSQLVNDRLYVIGGAEIVHPAPHPGIDSVEAIHRRPDW